jgi:DNA-binding protein HU-beta
VGQRVNQTTLIAATAVGLGIPVPKAKAVVDQFLEHAKGALLKGNQVLLSGFVSLGIRKYKARTGRNPMTGGTVKVPAGRKLVLKTSSAFKATLNVKKKKKAKRKPVAKKKKAKRKPVAKKKTRYR